MPWLAIHPAVQWPGDAARAQSRRPPPRLLACCPCPELEAAGAHRRGKCRARRDLRPAQPGRTRRCSAPPAAYQIDRIDRSFFVSSDQSGSVRNPPRSVSGARGRRPRTSTEFEFSNPASLRYLGVVHYQNANSSDGQIAGSVSADRAFYELLTHAGQRACGHRATSASTASTTPATWSRSTAAPSKARKCSVAFRQGSRWLGASLFARRGRGTASRTFTLVAPLPAADRLVTPLFRELLEDRRARTEPPA